MTVLTVPSSSFLSFLSFTTRQWHPCVYTNFIRTYATSHIDTYIDYAVLCCSMLCFAMHSKYKMKQKQFCVCVFVPFSSPFISFISSRLKRLLTAHLGAAAASKAQGALWEEAPTSCRRCPGRMGQKRSGVGESIIDDICHRVIIYNIIQLYDINICIICNNM